MSGIFQRASKARTDDPAKTNIQSSSSNEPSIPTDATASHEKSAVLPTHRINHNGHKVHKWVTPEGESGRTGLHPIQFLKVVWSSTSDASRAVNILWPVVPAAIAVRYAKPEWHLAIFILNYIGMVPCANLIGFAGQELARKLPRVFGILLETTLGSLVEIVLFMVLLNHNQFHVIQAAILGSILATLLLCLGLCFFVGGMRRDEQTFDEVISEVGSGLLLTAGLGLTVPTAFFTALNNNVAVTSDELDDKVLSVSRIASIFLMIAYAIYIWFQVRTHHSIYDSILEADEERDEDRHIDLHKDKLTLTECLIALPIAVALVTLIAIALVEQIDFIVERGVSDAFIGLILVPLVEKAAEHLTAVDEAWDNQMNFALSHVLGATVQTALFNAPLVIIVAWGLDKKLDLNFETFNIIVLILAILVVGNFLRDQKSNYLEGALCLIVYIIIAVAAYYYPNLAPESNGAGDSSVGEAIERLMR